MNKILITGGAGFIGSHLTEAFLRSGYEVIVADHLRFGRKANLQEVWEHPRFHFYRTDIRNKETMQSIFMAYRPELVCHHAAQKSIPASFEDPLNDAQVNIAGWLNVLMLSGEYGAANILYASSGGALGKEINGNERSAETDPPHFASPYAITKYAGENYLRLYREKFGYEYSILRYANVYGSRQCACGESGVIPAMISNIVQNKPSVLMTYPDMPQGCTRDFVYVSDVVSANLLLAKHPVNCAVNIGSGKEVSVLSLYETIQSVFGSLLPIVPAAARAGDVRRSALSTDKMKELTGWTPEVDLVTGLSLLKEWDQCMPSDFSSCSPDEPDPCPPPSSAVSSFGRASP